MILLCTTNKSVFFYVFFFSFSFFFFSLRVVIIVCKSQLVVHDGCVVFGIIYVGGKAHLLALKETKNKKRFLL